VNGCRCDDCTESNRVYFRQRRASQTAPGGASAPPGPVESGVVAEIAAVAESRPGLAATARAMARLLDDPRATSQQPAAAKVLIGLLDELRSTSARRRRGGLAVVRTMTEGRA
jgi:hypothetical protein